MYSQSKRVNSERKLVIQFSNCHSHLEYSCIKYNILQSMARVVYARPMDYMVHVSTNIHSALTMLPILVDMVMLWKPGHRYVCMYCKSVLTDCDGYSQHITQVHNAVHIPPVYPCKRCYYITDSLVDIDTHRSIHRLENQFKCPACMFLAETPESVTKHLKYCRIHTGPVVVSKCEHCDFIAWDKHTFESHSQLHELRRDEGEQSANTSQHVTDSSGRQEWRAGHKYYCTLSADCIHASASLHDYTSHVKQQHPDNIPHRLIPCKKCFFVADHRNIADKHELLHSVTSSVTCQRCCYRAESRKALLEHLQICSPTLMDAEDDAAENKGKHKFVLW